MLWLACDDDEFELPCVVCGSSEALAKWLGCVSVLVRDKARKNGRIKSGTKYYKIVKTEE